MKLSLLLFLFAFNAYASENLVCRMKIGGNEVSINVPINFPDEKIEESVLTYKKNSSTFMANYVFGQDVVRLVLNFKTKKKNTKKTLKVLKNSFVFEKHARNKFVRCEFDILFNDDISRMAQVFKLAKEDADSFYGEERLLYWAARRGRVKLFYYLYDLGARPFLLSENGNNALVGSILSNNLELVNFLVLRHVEMINQINIKNWTPLMYAAHIGNAKMAKLLVKSGALLDIQDEIGRSALMLAARKGNLDVARVLARGGAKLDLKRNNGMTAYMLAYKYGFSSIEKVLLNAGASSNLTNKTPGRYLSDDWDWDPEF